MSHNQLVFTSSPEKSQVQVHMTFQWSAEFGGVLNEIRSEFGRSYAVMQKRARCNSRHCEEESVSMDNGSRGCTASGRPSLLKRAWKEPNLKMYEEKNCA